MSSEKKLLRSAVLAPSGEERVKARHPWIFRGNLLQIPKCEPGDLIAFTDRQGERLGWGLWSEGNISIRVLLFGSHEPEQFVLLRRRLERALNLRKTFCAGEECFRWVHGEGDLLPGITADLYGDVLSLQLSIMGWYRHADEVAKIFRKCKKLSAIILRNDTKHLEKEGIPHEIKALLGEMPKSALKVKIAEMNELVDIAGGQKTGAYLDVRYAPNSLSRFFKGANVLDVFSYQGHFMLNALAGGANSVTCIDQSQSALDRALENIKLNNLDSDRVSLKCGNAFDILREIDVRRDRYDVVIMDPPPFSPARAQIDSARRGYKELAVRGFRRLEAGGRLLFLSCSQLFSRDMLLDVLADAARDAGRICRVEEEIHQPKDHPSLLGVTETDYLKGFVLGVEE